METRCADAGEWVNLLARDFPIQAEFDVAHVFENNELSVLVIQRGNRNAQPAEFLVEAVVRGPSRSNPSLTTCLGKPAEHYFFRNAHPKSYRREPEPAFWVPGVPQPAWCYRTPDPEHFDMKTFVAWVHDAGRYPLWLSILRRRDAERCASIWVVARYMTTRRR